MSKKKYNFKNKRIKTSLGKLRDVTDPEIEPGEVVDNAIYFHKAPAVIAQKYGHVMNEQEIIFTSHYCNPLSAGYRNPPEAGRRAGFSPDEANELTRSSWFNEIQLIINDVFLNNAEKKIFEIMNLDFMEETEVTRTSPKGTVTTEVKKSVSPSIVRIIADVAKFAAERKGGESWANKLTLEHEVGPQSIGELIDQLKHEDDKQNAITIESVDTIAEQGLEVEESILHQGQERTEGEVQAE